MQFNTLNSPRVQRKKVLHASRDAKNGYVISGTAWEGKIDVCMYNFPPTEDITLNEFDEIAQERMTALKVVEEMKERYTLGSDDWRHAMNVKLKPIFPIAVEHSGLGDKAKLHWRRRDVIGHFILRLACCRSPEQTRWFINQEVDLFRFRFNHFKWLPHWQIEFLKTNDISIDVVSNEERHELGSGLERSFGTMPPLSGLQCYFKLPFTDAFDLIRRRRVYLRCGTAYIHPESLAIAVAGHLRTQMMATMTRAYKQLALLEEENRIFPRLSRLMNNVHTGKTYKGEEKGDKVSRNQINDLCRDSFPPCMKQIHNRLRTDHHLRHGARRQYGLFLKAIGLPLDEALAFIREEFTKKIDSDKFEKQYAYNIRHMYGKEGKRVAASAMACSTIILNNPPAAGCPFKHNDSALLAQRLTRENLTKEQVNQVLEFTKAHAYDKACTRFFEFTHKMESGALGKVITHPNEFFELSKEVHSGNRARDNHIHASQTQSFDPILNPYGLKVSYWNPAPVPPRHIIEEKNRIAMAERKKKTEANNTNDSDSDW